eukprot:5569844-Alexandrium_andersonii.AAC.1
MAFWRGTQRLLCQQGRDQPVEARRPTRHDGRAHDGGRAEGSAGSAMASEALPPAAAATSSGHS